VTKSVKRTQYQSGAQVNDRRGDRRLTHRAIRAIRGHFWRSLVEGFELSWFHDPSVATASQVMDRTLGRMRESQAIEEEWRAFFS
jgi:hypothetical protein